MLKSRAEPQCSRVETECSPSSPSSPSASNCSSITHSARLSPTTTGAVARLVTVPCITLPLPTLTTTSLGTNTGQAEQENASQAEPQCDAERDQARSVGRAEPQSDHQPGDEAGRAEQRSQDEQGEQCQEEKEGQAEQRRKRSKQSLMDGYLGNAKDWRDQGGYRPRPSQKRGKQWLMSKYLQPSRAEPQCSRAEAECSPSSPSSPSTSNCSSITHSARLSPTTTGAVARYVTVPSITLPLPTLTPNSLGSHDQPEQGRCQAMDQADQTSCQAGHCDQQHSVATLIRPDEDVRAEPACSTTYEKRPSRAEPQSSSSSSSSTRITHSVRLSPTTTGAVARYVEVPSNKLPLPTLTPTTLGKSDQAEQMRCQALDQADQTRCQAGRGDHQPSSGDCKDDEERERCQVRAEQRRVQAEPGCCQAEQRHEDDTDEDGNQNTSLFKLLRYEHHPAV